MGTAKLIEAGPDDCYMIAYTSGTTGNPKGVKMIQKSTAIANQHMVYLNTPGDEICSSDVYFSYLPLAHVME